MWPWRVKMPTQNLLRLFLLLMLMMRNVHDSCMQICKLKFGHEAKFCSDFELKVWSRVWSWSSSKILKLKFGQNFAALVRLWSGCLVKILKFGRNAEVGLRFWILEFDQDLCKNMLLWWAELKNSGPLCLWQCLYHVTVKLTRWLGGQGGGRLQEGRGGVVFNFCHLQNSCLYTCLFFPCIEIGKDLDGESWPLVPPSSSEGSHHHHL